MSSDDPTRRPCGYRHVQVGKLHWLLWAVAAVALWAGSISGGAAGVSMQLAGAPIVVLSLCFVTLEVRDEGDHLLLRYGPVSLFRKRVPYDEITSVEAGRTAVIDGWGIHLVPGRGWTYNLWGRDCAELRLGTQRMRIGTDDPEGLVAFLRGRIAA